MPETKACVFCRIVSGELPAHRVYEDDRYLGFFSIQPMNPGHTLLVPKAHRRWVLDVEDFGGYWEVAKKIALATKSALGADSVSFVTLGYEIPHAHIWIVPRFPNDGHPGTIDWSNVKKIPPEEMERMAEKIRNEIGGS